MVVRPPIEKWSRVELEEHFHSTYQQLRTAQKKINEQEKKITMLNTRLRSSVMERKAKDDAYVEREKFDELQRENQLLALKLKTVKHQILTYTTPSARPVTASVMTGRTTYRPQHTMRRPFTGSAIADRTSRTNQNIDEARTPQHRVSEVTLREKASYIRLNRLVREKSSQIAEMQYEIDRLNRLLADLRSQLEQKSSMVRDLEVEVRNARERTTDDQHLNQVELINKQLAVVEAENEVLKEANERLVKQSLSMEFDESVKEQIELKKQISLLEEKIRESERRRLKAEQILRNEKRKAKRNSGSAATREIEYSKSIESIDDVNDVSDVITPVKESTRKRYKESKNENDILERLYQDVAAILESHDINNDKAKFVSPGDSMQQIARWKKMYAALYDELEKLRNMLLIQHDINQKQSTEIKLLQEEMESVKKKYESKLKEMRDTLMEKQKRILLLEEQIRSIAYGAQKPTTLKAAETKPEFSTDLSITLTEIRLADEFIAAVGTCPAYFLSLEFFDFELQTTPILTKPASTLDFTTVYNVVVSNLFLHFVETNGITIELYSPRSSNYILLAAAVVNLKPLLQKNAKSRIVGELKMISLDSGSTVATIKYELSATDELETCIASYQAAEAAQKMLPIEIPQQREEFEELTVIVNRCTGLDKLKKGELEVCVIYEFFSFSPYFTHTVTSSKTAEFNSRRDWSIPVEALHSYLTETEITFFLFENRPESAEDKDGVLAMLSLPLAPLAENKPLKGTFEMIKVDGSDCGVFLDVNVMWKHGLTLAASKPRPSEPKISEKEDKSPAPHIVAAPSVDLIRSGSTSLEDAVYSPASVASPKIPIVAESGERDALSTERDDIETVSLKQHSRRSSPESEAAMEDEVKSGDGLTSSSSNASDVKPSEMSQPSPESNQNALQEETLESDVHLDESASSKERDKDEIRSLLGNLPPVAKPRLLKASLESSNLPFLNKPASTVSEESANKESSSESEEAALDRQRTVAFTDPLHRSIPPSESSSTSSPPLKPAVPLPTSGGRSVIKVTKEDQQEDSDTDENRTVSIFIDRIYVPESSRLLHHSYDDVKVYVDWFFLDYPLEESRTPNAIRLPRVPDSPGIFAYKKEFQLSRRRVALLQQWLELGNRLDFTLVTEGEDSEELAVAQLELGQTGTDQTTTIQFLDINGEHYADLDLVISYSSEIFDCLGT